MDFIEKGLFVDVTAPASASPASTVEKDSIRKGARNKVFDGLRGFGMLILMSAHFGLGKLLPGAWIGINFFLVFSGFIIVYLMMVERAKTGRISISKFYRRRARRLLPGLFVLLVTLAVWGLLFADDHVRRTMRGDIFATLGYVMNWRLIVTSDDYFAQGGVPSMLRHAWTLAVEEQFYLFAPLLVLAVIRWVSARWLRVSIMLGLASVSALIAASIGSSTPSAFAHSYYGTDTRSQAIFAGIALAFLVSPDVQGRQPKLITGPLISTIGWASLIFNVALYFFVEPTDTWLFEYGGMLLINISILPFYYLGMVSHRSWLEIIMGNKFFVFLGMMTYGLYLWHWPIQIWLAIYAPDLDSRRLLLIGSSLTIGIAFVSFRWLEAPIMMRGLAPFAGGVRKARLLVTTSLTLIIGLTVALGFGSFEAPRLNPQVPVYIAGDGHRNITAFGDSSARLFFERFQAEDYPDLSVTNLAIDGCDLVRLDVKWTDKETRAPEAVCLEARASLEDDVRVANTDVFVLMSGGVASLDHISEDGRTLGVNDPEYRAIVEAELDDIFGDARAAGVSDLRLMTVPCRENDLSKVSIFGIDVEPYLSKHPDKVDAIMDPVVMNGWFRDWAEKNDVEIIDLYKAIGCETGFQRKINGITLFVDWFHFSHESSVMIWTWLAPKLQVDATGG